MKYKITQPVKTYFILLFVLLSLLFGGSHAAQAQRYQGKFGAKRKLFGNHKKKYRHIKKKKKRKKLKHRSRNRSSRKRALSRKRKKMMGGRKKSLYGHKKKGRRKRGRYPKNKSQLGTKVSATAFSGMAIGQSGNNINSEGETENVFANAKPAPTLGMGAYYHFMHKGAIGLKAEAIPFSSEDRSIRSVNIGLNFKYNLLPERSFISPYLGVGLNYAFAHIKDPGQINEETLGEDFDEGYSVDDGTHILVTEIVQEEPDIETGIIPMYGYELFGGFDIKVNNKIGVFFQVEYHSSIAGDIEKLKKYYPNNKGNFNFIGFSAGVKFNLFKNKSLY